MPRLFISSTKKQYVEYGCESTACAQTLPHLTPRQRCTHHALQTGCRRCTGRTGAAPGVMQAQRGACDWACRGRCLHPIWWRGPSRQNTSGHIHRCAGEASSLDGRVPGPDRLRTAGALSSARARLRGSAEGRQAHAQPVLADLRDERVHDLRAAAFTRSLPPRGPTEHACTARAAHGAAQPRRERLS